MPRYYLHQVHQGELIEDREGVELPSLEAAREEARAAAREIMAERLLQGRAPNHSRFEIKDEHGRLLHVTEFSDAIPSPGSQP